MLTYARELVKLSIATLPSPRRLRGELQVRQVQLHVVPVRRLAEEEAEVVERRPRLAVAGGQVERLLRVVEPERDPAVAAGPGRVVRQLPRVRRVAGDDPRAVLLRGALA